MSEIEFGLAEGTNAEDLSLRPRVEKDSRHLAVITSAEFKTGTNPKPEGFAVMLNMQVVVNTSNNLEEWDEFADTEKARYNVFCGYKNGDKFIFSPVAVRNVQALFQALGLKFDPKATKINPEDFIGRTLSLYCAHEPSYADKQSSEADPEHTVMVYELAPKYPQKYVDSNGVTAPVNSAVVAKYEKKDSPAF